ncbi:MAG: polysaccharide pyruvyl transferase family protein [Flavobacteriaceae bacterium]|nr:MAG: polysaccharide pyruvyl transferase family protein [Flavobacteriaceae bacterium]
MVRQPDQIVIIGGSIWGNRGASAMLETTIHKVRETNPAIKIIVFTPYPKKDESLSIDSSLTFYDSRPQAIIQYFLQAVWAWIVKKFGGSNTLSGAAGALTQSNLLLDIGGITFADGRLIFLPYNILTIWPSILHNVPVIKLSQAAGSFKNPIIRWASQVFLSRCDYFFARGEKTLEHLTGLNLDMRKVSLASDIAFSYKPSFCLSRENQKSVEQLCEILRDKAGKGEKIIGISPSILVSDKMRSADSDYSSIVIDMLKKSDYQNQTYVIFPNAAREGSKKTKNNDLHVIQALRDIAELELPYSIYNKIYWVNYDLDSSGVEAVINHTNLVISSRFHAMVASLRLAKPTLVIGWGHKYKEVMKQFGLQDFVFDYRMDRNELPEKINFLHQNVDEIIQKIQIALRHEIKISQQQFDYVSKKISQNSKPA